MALINYPLKEMTIKVVYYGPGLSGKTSSLKYIFEHLPEKKKGKIVTIATEGDRTFFFDFLPISGGKIGDFNTRIQLYTVPGQVFYEKTRRMVLQGTDAVIFVADSQPQAMQANKDSMSSLVKNLKVNNLDPAKIPIVLAYNKRDLPAVLPVPTLNQELNLFGSQYFETSAVTGERVVETLKSTLILAFQSVKERYRFQNLNLSSDDTVIFDKEMIKEEEDALALPLNPSEDEALFTPPVFDEPLTPPRPAAPIVREEPTFEREPIPEISPVDEIDVALLYPSTKSELDSSVFPLAKEEEASGPSQEEPFEEIFPLSEGIDPAMVPSPEEDIFAEEPLHPIPPTPRPTSPGSHPPSPQQSPQAVPLPPLRVSLLQNPMDLSLPLIVQGRDGEERYVIKLSVSLERVEP